MRGGRGSRGGSRGGGRSRSYRSSSRRYYRNRRRYGNTYIFGGYYGGSHSTTTLGRRGSLILLFVFLGIIYLIGSLIAYGVLSSPTTDRVFLEPGRQKLVELPSNLKSAHIVFPGDIYIMDTAPTTSGTSTIPNRLSETVPSDSYVYWQISVSTGTVVDVLWTASGSLSVYLLEGLSEFNRWVDGETPAGSFIDSGSSGSFSYTASRNIDIYVAFENPGFGNPTIQLTRTITIKEPRYDTSQGTHFKGEANVDLQNTKFVILENNEQTDLEAIITKEKEFTPRQFQITWGILTLSLIFLAIFVLIKFGDDKPRAVASQPMTPVPASPSVQIQQTSWAASPTQTTSWGAPPTQPNSWTAPMVRPEPKYCPSCLSPILASDKFCGSCGVNLS
ncbi:MAG: hypothetical protein D6732_15245 [Methanobacteriota archaeon]|nr:MAG: hypothetical protein D6732_15245 [Euryarchaeota archaeon]